MVNVVESVRVVMPEDGRKLEIGQRVKHPGLGWGTINTVNEQRGSVSVSFDDGKELEIAGYIFTDGDPDLDDRVVTEPVSSIDEGVFGPVPLAKIDLVKRPATEEEKLEAEIDDLILAIQEFRQRGRAARVREGAMLFRLREKIFESKQRDWLKTIETLGYKQATVYDLIHQYEDHQAAMTPEVANAGERQPEPSTESPDAVDADEVLTPKPDPQADQLKKLINQEQAKRRGRMPTHGTTLHTTLRNLSTEDLDAYHIYRRAHPARVTGRWHDTFNEIVALQRAADEADAENHYNASDEDLPPSLGDRDEQQSADDVMPPTEGPVNFPATAEGA
jgi:hypothetical protein